MFSEDLTPRAERALVAALVISTFASAVALLSLGAGFVLDDWFPLRNAHFDGTWGAPGGPQGGARPGSYPIYALVFGGFGTHPLPGILLLAALNSATAVLTYRLLRRMVPSALAALVAVLWVVLPTRTSTEFWVTCSLHAVSQLALTGALVLAARIDRTRWQLWGSWLLLAASVAAYEASLPAAALGAVVVPWLVRRKPDVRYVAGAAVACGLPALWVLTHWYSGKSIQELADPARLFYVNFGWGITPDGPGSALVTPLVLAVLVGVCIAAVRAVLSSLTCRTEDVLVLAGLAVMVVGFLPFVRYYYEPQGAGDRANFLSAVGGAMVWAGLVAMVGRLDRRLAGLAVVTILAIAVPARWERIQVWSAAEKDAQVIADAVVEEHPNPTEQLVLGPKPIIRWNVAAFVDRSNIQSALELLYDREHVDVVLTLDPDEWEAADPTQRVDIRPLSKLDDLPVLGS